MTRRKRHGKNRLQMKGPWMGKYLAATSPHRGLWYLSGYIPAANCLAAYQPKGAASLAASYINLANAGTNNAAPGNAPDWDATNGWKFNGTNDFLTTGITPATGYTMIIRFSDYTGGNTYPYLAGNLNTLGTAGFAFACGSPAATPVRDYQHGGGKSAASGSTSGIMAVAGATGYLNGASDVTDIPAGVIPAIEIYIGGHNQQGVGLANRAAYYNQAMAIYNIVLTPTQVAAVTTAMAAL